MKNCKMVEQTKKLFKTLCNHRSEENRTRYNATCNKTKKVVVKTIRMKLRKKIEAFSEFGVNDIDRKGKKETVCGEDHE